jgi:hypothetical protein
MHMNTTTPTAKPATADLDTLLERIAQQHLSIETLATRNRDALDLWLAGENDVIAVDRPTIEATARTLLTLPPGWPDAVE